MRRERRGKLLKSQVPKQIERRSIVTRGTTWRGSWRPPARKGLPVLSHLNVRLLPRHCHGVRGPKQALLVSLRMATEGASIDTIVAATGWLPHTVRAALADEIAQVRLWDRAPARVWWQECDLSHCHACAADCGVPQMQTQTSDGAAGLSPVRSRLLGLRDREPECSRS